MTTKHTAQRIAQGRGADKADLVLKGGQFLNLVTGDLVASDVAICGDMIVGTYGSYDGVDEVDVSGHVLVPGFIDTHLHVESSLVTPYEFDRCVLRHGVTTAICDPHEIANVLGVDGIRYFLDCAMNMVMDLRVQLSSCVPATHLETAGAAVTASDLQGLMFHSKTLGLAEFMNYPGVLNNDAACLEKLTLFEGRHIDGHAPLLRGQDLNGYLSAGISTDHEATTADEALEKLAKGMHVLIREGSVSKDLHALLPIMTERHSDRIALCTDDRNPLDIAEEGHLDFMIRTAIAHGVPPLVAYRAASLSGARAFRMQDRGLIAPRYRADIAILSNLEHCRVANVIAAGSLVKENDFNKRRMVSAPGRESVQLPRLSIDQLRVKPHGGNQHSVIGVDAGKIITQHLKFDLLQDETGVQGDLSRDVVKVAVIERHGKNGNIGTGFVHGFGLKQGAIASTIGHDSHNLCVIGANDADMIAAALRLSQIEGGFVVVHNGMVLAELALPIAGLMSDQPFEVVRDKLMLLRKAAKGLGCTLPEPFLQVAFLPLPVIPHLKISDMGLVDVDQFRLVSA